MSTTEGYNRGVPCPLMKVITEVCHVHYRRLQQRCVMSTTEGYNRGVSCPLQKVMTEVCPLQKVITEVCHVH